MAALNRSTRTASKAAARKAQTTPSVEPNEESYTRTRIGSDELYGQLRDELTERHKTLPFTSVRDEGDRLVARWWDVRDPGGSADDTENPAEALGASYAENLINRLAAAPENDEETYCELHNIVRSMSFDKETQGVRIGFFVQLAKRLAQTKIAGARTGTTASPTEGLIRDINDGTPSGLATNYFVNLMKDPSSVALAGYLDDARIDTGDDRDTGLDEFGEKLQEHLANVARQVKRVGIMVHTEAFNEATCRLSEARHVLDALHEVAQDPEALHKLTIPSNILLAERLVEEGYELLTVPYEDHEERAKGDAA